MTRVLRGLALVSVATMSISVSLLGCSQRDGDDAIRSAVEADEPLRQVDLTGQSRLRNESRNTSQLWIDGNAMKTGDARVVAGRFVLDKGPPSEGSLVLSAQRLLQDYVADIAIELAGDIESWKPSTNNADFDTLLAEVARIVTVEGFYLEQTEENVAPIRSQMDQLVSLLGEKDDVTLVRAHSYAFVDGSPNGHLRRVSLGLCVNRVSGEFVAFFSRQGWDAPAPAETNEAGEGGDRPSLGIGPAPL